MEEETIVKLKAKVMLQKIDKLCEVYIRNLDETNELQINALKIIKKQFLLMYNELITRREYEKYREIEDIVIKEISKVELKLDEYVFSNRKDFQKIITKNKEEIYNSENYIFFQNVEELLNKLEILNQLFKRYSSYMSRKKEEEFQHQITCLKFDILYRKQVEELIYQNGNTNIGQYINSEEEKAIFKKILGEKLVEIVDIEDSLSKDNIFATPVDQILNNKKLLERLIIIDMKRNPYNYIELVKAKIFNAHLCNIGDNPFEKEVYYYGRDKNLEINRVNYSLLNAILESIITDDNISLIECINLYKRFGFKCRPILINDGQRCIKIIYNAVKGSKQYEKILQKERSTKKSKQKEYCKIDFTGLVYEFYKDVISQILVNFYEDKRNLEELLNKRDVKISSKNKKTKKQKISREEEQLQIKKQKVKNTGIITKDIDVAILLIKDIIAQYNSKMSKNDNSSDIFDSFFSSREENMQIVKKLSDDIQWLEELKNKKEQLTLDESRRLLLTINNIYKEIHVAYDAREILPLENMGSKNSSQVYLAPVPKLYIPSYKRYEPDYETRDIRPLWEEYKKQFKDLNIDVLKYTETFDGEIDYFEICVNLGDISDLPIDYQKVKLLTKEKINEIMERDKCDRDYVL